MPHPDPTPIVIDASAIWAALRAPNPDVCEEILQQALRQIIATGQESIANLSTDTAPLKVRIRVPISGHPRPSTTATPSPQGMIDYAPSGHNGQSVAATEALGPKAAARYLGVARSTLDNWRRDGLIIALPKGKNSHVIPLVQFVQSRPHRDVASILIKCDGDAIQALKEFTTLNHKEADQ